VQIGHSLATAEQVAVAFGRGMAGFTHLFNAMSGIDRREPGVPPMRWRVGAMRK
jgi:N-acetylglucosamine-6-phosphate deacetylase